MKILVDVPLDTLKAVEAVLAEAHQNCEGDEADTIFAKPLRLVREAIRAAQVQEAAPDLLAALKALMKEVEASGNAAATDFNWPAAVASARAAIAKAGGR